MDTEVTDRSSSSVSPKVSSSVVILKREPVENDSIHSNKRRLGECLSHDKDTILSNKRQMATKRHQYSDNIQSKLVNGSNDEQQHKQTESHLGSNSPKTNNQKLFSNGETIDTLTSPLNLQSKLR